MKMRKTSILLVLWGITCSITTALSQCPERIWGSSNHMSTYIYENRDVSHFGKFANTGVGSYINDGDLFFLGDIVNDGYIGDGFGREYIGSCHEAITVLEGRGTTEFNRLTLDNSYGLDLNKWMTIKSELRFSTGIVHTDRYRRSEKIIFDVGAIHSGSRDVAHIDGVASRLGIGPFIFPLGDGDHLSPIMIRATSPFDEFESSYFSQNLDSTNWVAKGVYPADSMDYNVIGVQPREFWTMEGAAATPVTLYWTDYSQISDLAPSTDDLIIVGWKQDRWVNLGQLDKVEFFGTGTLSSKIVRPDQYDAFTFGVLDTDGDDVADSEDDDPFDPCDPDPTTDACVNNICLSVNIGVWLEGPLYRSGEYIDEMDTRLHDFGYLPGMRPRTLLGTGTDPGQPYRVAPWLYSGTEGREIDELGTIISGEAYPEEAVDWVLVSLRTSADQSSTLCTKAGLLLKNGEIIMTDYFDCCTTDQDDYYIVVEHRNHLAVMTPTPVSADSAGVLTFDFRTTPSYTSLLGYGQKEISPGRYVMYAGNGDQMLSFESSRDINSNDNGAWARDNGRHSGYYFQDYDMNGDVNVHDKSLWAINNGIFTDVEPIHN